MRHRTLTYPPPAGDMPAPPDEPPRPLMPWPVAWALRQGLAELAAELARAAAHLPAAPPELSPLPLDPPPPSERPTLRSPYAGRPRC